MFYLPLFVGLFRMVFYFTMTTVSLNLRTASPAEINAAVAEHVAKWTDVVLYSNTASGEPPIGCRRNVDNYVNDASLLIVLLEKWNPITVEYCLKRSGWLVQIWKGFPGAGPESGCPNPPHIDIEHEGTGPTFNLAAIAALLRANGVEVSE